MKCIIKIQLHRNWDGLQGNNGLQSLMRKAKHNPLHFIAIVNQFLYTDDSKPICRNNLCGEEGGDIRCRRGKVVHLLAAECFSGEKNCSSDVYQSLYRICEGQRSCQLNHIRRELRFGFCRGHGVEYKDVLVDFTCIDGKTFFTSSTHNG